MSEGYICNVINMYIAHTKNIGLPKEKGLLAPVGENKF